VNGTDAAAVTQQALIAAHNARMVGGPKVALPNGIRVSADPYIGVRYPGEDATRLLGEPRSVLLHPRPGAMYVWRSRTEARTAAMVRAHHLRPVEMKEINPDCALADVVELETPSGTFVMWETLALFEMPPQCIERYYTGYEKYAIGRLAQQAMDFDDTARRTSGGAYKGELTAKT
jgi:hypothetical protein